MSALLDRTVSQIRAEGWLDGLEEALWEMGELKREGFMNDRGEEEDAAYTAWKNSMGNDK